MEDVYNGRMSRLTNDTRFWLDFVRDSSAPARIFYICLNIYLFICCFLLFFVVCVVFVVFVCEYNLVTVHLWGIFNAGVMDATGLTGMYLLLLGVLFKIFVVYFNKCWWCIVIDNIINKAIMFVCLFFFYLNDNVTCLPPLVVPSVQSFLLGFFIK